MRLDTNLFVAEYATQHVIRPNHKHKQNTVLNTRVYRTIAIIAVNKATTENQINTEGHV